MPRKRPDERDVIFSRMDMNKQERKEYYDRFPDKKEVDAELRGMPWEKPMGDSMGYKLFDALEKSFYDVQHVIEKHADEASPKDIPICDDANQLTRALDTIMKMMKVEDWGIAKVDEIDFYTYKGRGKNKNMPIKAEFPYAIVYLTSMDKDMVNRAPRFETMLATLRGYTDIALLGFQLTSYINRVGYNADNNMTSRYISIMPPLGEKAGLGSMGRHGLMVTKKWGSRVRLGAILTDMPLITNKLKAFDIKPFCEKCGLCARTCPGRAIDEGLCPDDGWKINDVDCYRIWRALGTDCGICLSACPLTQGVDENLLENIEDEDTIKRILKEHNDKYGVRKYIKEELDFLKD